MCCTPRPHPRPAPWQGLVLIAAVAWPLAAEAAGGPAPAANPSARRPAPPRPGQGDSAESRSANSSTGWWTVPNAVVAVLAVVGVVSWTHRRFRPGPDAPAIRVLGRSSLSGKHAVHLVRVGDRVLILGTGPQGPPAILGEVDDPAELDRPAAPAAPAPMPRRLTAAAGSKVIVATPPRPSAGFDRRIGDDE